MTRKTLLLALLGLTPACGYWEGGSPTKPVAPAQWSTSVIREPAVQRPPVAGAAEATRAGEEPKHSSCTVEQILAMKRAGLTDHQVKAACPE